MVPLWFFFAFALLGLIGGGVTLVYCIYVSVKEALSGSLLRRGE